MDAMIGDAALREVIGADALAAVAAADLCAALFGQLRLVFALKDVEQGGRAAL